MVYFGPYVSVGFLIIKEFFYIVTLARTWINRENF